LAQLGFLNRQEFVWLYGHEHRLTVYQPQPIASSPNAHPRCIGHGGMPVELTTLSQPDSNILYYDPGQHPIDNSDPNTMAGYNGHIVLFFDGNQLTIEYHDIVNNSLLLTETFTPIGNGALRYSFSKPADSRLVSGQQTS
jgi:hypothetical protein